jgi:hypothetical protein
MKKIINILFASILALSLANFAQAGEMTVTGSAQATYTITSSDSATGQIEKSPGLGMANELAFNANGEFGNGYTWTYQIELDPAQGSGAALNDDTRMELTTPYGTIGIYGSEGDLNTHLSNSVAAYAPGHDIGTGGGYQGGTGMNSYNNLQYHTPADLLPFGTSVKLAWSNGDSKQSADANDAGSASTNNVNSYQVTTKPIDGLTVGASYLEKSNSGTTTKQKYETGGAYAKYNIGAFSVGVGRHFVAPNTNSGGSTSLAKTDALITSTSNSAVYSADSNGSTTINAGVEYFQNDALSIAFAVNENLSLSWDRLTSTAEARKVVATTRADTDVSRDLEITTLQAAYNIGGAVVAVSTKSVYVINYAKGKDPKETTLSLKMAF